jgi:hypothetical protein
MSRNPEFRLARCGDASQKRGQKRGQNNFSAADVLARSSPGHQSPNWRKRARVAKKLF